MRCSTPTFALAAALAAGAPLSAQLISTGYNGTGQASVAGTGNFFNVTALEPAGVFIGSFDNNCQAAAGTPVTVDVYYRAGGYEGFETSPGDWTLLGSAGATAAGQGKPTFVDVGGLHIPAGQTYGLRIAFQNGGARWSLANQMTTPVANGHVRIDLGASQNGLFAGTLATPRGWNGSIHYGVGSTPPARGACCLPDVTCASITEGQCLSRFGIYQGDESACATVTCPQPGACCIALDFTCTILSQGQCAAAPGTYMGHGTACAACPPAPAGTVAIVAAAGATIGDPRFADVRDKLMATGNFPAVAVFHAGLQTPTLGYLQQFSAMLTWSNTNYTSGAALGNVLADYVDGGGGVVVAVFANTTTGADRSLTGRWTPDYEIIPARLDSAIGSVSLGTVHDPQHPIMSGVGTLQSGSVGSRPATLLLTSHGVKVAEWSDGRTLVAVSTQYPRRVDLGLYPPSGDVGSGLWLSSTDGAILMANALRYATAPVACYGNCDQSTTVPVLNVADFTCFLQRFAAGESYANCDDSTTVPVLNVADFTCFLQQFAAGCP